jgi:hypothetical protein
MRILALAPLLTLPLALTGCGAKAPSGAAALKVVKGDWEFNNVIPSRPDLQPYTQVLDSSRCDEKLDARRQVHCELHVHDPSTGRSRTVPVIVTFSSNGVVSAWDLAR